MKNLFFVLCILTCLSCGRFSELEEGDRNTFTWKGQLVIDCDGEPAASRIVYLERHTSIYDISDPNTFLDPYDSKVEQIAMDVTDAQGNFSLTFKTGRGYSLRFYVETSSGRKMLDAINGGNKNYERDFAIENCLQTQFIVENRGAYDSIYVYGLSELFSEFDTTHIGWVDQNGWDRSAPAVAIPLLGSDFAGYYELRDAYYAYNRAANWGRTIDELGSTINAAFIDSLPEDYQSEWWYTKGYPAVDTVRIILD